MSKPGENNSNTCTYRFLSSSLADLPENRDYHLTIRQQPRQAKACVGSSLLERRYPIEPAPILQVDWINCAPEQTKNCLQSPFYFAVANIVDSNCVHYHHPQHGTPPNLLDSLLVGTTISSLHRLRDLNNTDGGFFVFGDLSVRKEGDYKLHFSLFEIVENVPDIVILSVNQLTRCFTFCLYYRGTVQNRKTVLSDVFSVYTAKSFPGPLETTFLSRTFSDQGVKIRIRKENRLQASANSRKRRLEVQALMDNTSSPTVTLVHHQQYYPNEKRFKEIIEDEGFSPPPYAATKTDVYFGRWQANTTTTTTSSPTSLSLPISSSSTTTSTIITAPPSPPKSITSSLPSPPMPSLVHEKEWGERLPPLRAIMTDAFMDNRTLPPLHTTFMP
ncbi:velvet factor-domain-containing protein [Phascolomyces articulosus]|uniref:Velvet factor-domain-containing protein n=1 Tax=Phascolomyces articulosus TaxID=60185 RepID=A0AAD5JVE6_9FUNG|nr:velvet factor-domain-containing protein [Phascolomyces articulosus]